MRLVVLLIALLGITAQSCGSRKVELHKRINDLETTLNIKIRELQLERKKLSEYIYTESFRADSIIEEGGKRKIYNPIIDKKEDQKISEEEKITDIQKEINQTEIDKSSIKDKGTDREQFSWWWIVLFVVVGWNIFLHKDDF